jgi:hypothetical protein
MPFTFYLDCKNVSNSSTSFRNSTIYFMWACGLFGARLLGYCRGRVSKSCHASEKMHAYFRVTYVAMFLTENCNDKFAYAKFLLQKKKEEERRGKSH